MGVVGAGIRETCQDSRIKTGSPSIWVEAKERIDILR